MNQETRENINLLRNRIKSFSINTKLYNANPSEAARQKHIQDRLELSILSKADLDLIDEEIQKKCTNLVPAIPSLSYNKPELDEQQYVSEDHEAVPFPIRVANKFVSLYRSAKSRNKEFNISYLDVYRLLSRKTCYYTGIPFDDDINKRSIDRIDSSRGYVKGNVVACSLRVNQIKNKLFEDKSSSMYMEFKHFESLVEKFGKRL